MTMLCRVVLLLVLATPFAADAAAEATDDVLLQAMDGAAGDRFGFSVAASGNVVAVGAPGASVNGNDEQGAVYLYRRSGDEWRLVTKLVALDGEAGERFGHSVSLCGGLLVVGAPDAKEQGAVYVFEYQAGSWIPSKTLAARDGASGEQFGASVSADAKRIVVGAPRAAAPSPSPGYRQGAAYVFDRVGQDWQERARLADAEGGFLDLFGSAVALSGERLAIAAEGYADFAGAVYVFERRNGEWLQASFHAPGPHTNGSGVGSSVALTPDVLAIGAEYSGTDDTLVPGVVYLQARGDAAMTTLVASDWSAAAGFGGAIAADARRLVVGAPWIGKVYLFEQAGGGWQEVQRWPNDEPTGGFGSALALPAGFIAIGESSASVNGRYAQGQVHLVARED